MEFKLPDIGEGVAEGEIVRWLVSEGDAIKEDQPMVEVMTDKATVEITSPVTGSVGKILAADGEVVPVHSVIVHLEGEGGGAAAAPAKKSPPAETTRPASPEPVMASAPPAPASNGGKVLAAPATRRLAREHGVDIAQVTPTGPRGRVTRDDLMNFLQGAPVSAPTAAATAPAAATPTSAPTPVFQPQTFTPGGTETIPYRGIRKATGDQMVRSAFTSPHFTYVDEVDMTDLYALRKQAAQIGAEQGVKVTFLPFIVKALCAAIRRHPTVNSELREEQGEIVVKHDIHVGIATDTPNGLMVPVVKHAHQRSALEIAAEINRLTEAARTGKASRDELSGSTITITSAGSIGGLFATPIINYPEAAIIGVYQIKDKPVIRDGDIVPGKIGYLSITLDHRVVDGATAAHFMNHVKRLLENPGLLVLEN